MTYRLQVILGTLEYRLHTELVGYKSTANLDHPAKQCLTGKIVIWPLTFQNG